MDIEKRKMYRQKYYYSKKGQETTKAYTAKYNRENGAKIREYVNNRRKTDVEYRLKCNLRSRLSMRIKRLGIHKTRSSVKDLGCSMDFLKQYLEAKFQPGMTWDNYGRNGWHIDHIKPLSSFDLTNPEEFKCAVHYTNLQPLWAMDNFTKNNKYINSPI